MSGTGSALVLMKVASAILGVVTATTVIDNVALDRGKPSQILNSNPATVQESPATAVDPEVNQATAANLDPSAGATGSVLNPSPVGTPELIPPFVPGMPDFDDEDDDEYEDDDDDNDDEDDDGDEIDSDEDIEGDD